MNRSRRTTTMCSASGCAGLINRLQSGTPRYGTMALGSSSSADTPEATQLSPPGGAAAAPGPASQHG
ncbi:hypothetical protein G6F32_017504 [Rhizopus arrhizus]|nr:hypothetical protein G6F32_017504 [Rhizopus arrhizus]